MNLEKFSVEELNDLIERAQRIIDNKSELVQDIRNNNLDIDLEISRCNQECKVVNISRYDGADYWLKLNIGDVNVIGTGTCARLAKHFNNLSKLLHTSLVLNNKLNNS